VLLINILFSLFSLPHSNCPDPLCATASRIPLRFRSIFYIFKHVNLLKFIC